MSLLSSRNQLNCGKAVTEWIWKYFIISLTHDSNSGKSCQFSNVLIM